MALVCIPGTERETWVNPAHVTSVLEVPPYSKGPYAGRPRVEVEFIGNAGYHTRRVDAYAPIAKVIATINQETT